MQLDPFLKFRPFSERRIGERVARILDRWAAADCEFDRLAETTSYVAIRFDFVHLDLALQPDLSQLRAIEFERDHPLDALAVDEGARFGHDMAEVLNDSPIHRIRESVSWACSMMQEPV